MKLSVGDVVIGVESHNKDIVREITEVRDTGYTWKYEDGFRDYWSENSSDPFFEYGWKIRN